jgi:peptidoglycan/xylan/chitin deacetylase (PgdA/CDA1 family)
MLTLLLLLLLVFLVVYPFYAIYKPPKLLIQYFQHRWPDVLWEVDVPKGQKVVALTIDDAPSEHTEEILKVLKENGARATFFVIGAQVDGREGVLNKMVAEGMGLGNHAMHDEPSRSLPLSTLESQIKDVQTKIDDAYSLVGRPQSKTRFFRPGSGFFTDAMRELVKKMGYQLTLGSVYPHDPQIPYAWVNARHVLSMVRPGAVIICHDRRDWTAPMLRKVLPKLKKKGWEVVPLDELVERGKKVEVAA